MGQVVDGHDAMNVVNVIDGLADTQVCVCLVEPGSRVVFASADGTYYILTFGLVS